MIVREQPHALKLFFVVQGSIVPRILIKITFISVLALIVTLADHYVDGIPRISISAMGIFGVALSLFLGFRNNAAYDRWWEARKQWGHIIADTRALGRHLNVFVEDSAQRQAILENAVAFAHLHRGFLRKVDVRPSIAPWIGEEHSNAVMTSRNPPDRVLKNMSRQVHDLGKSGAIDGFGQMTLTQTLSSIGLAQAANERIFSTPLPFVYSLLVRRTTYLYCGLLPFALIDAANGFAPLFAGVVAYVFFGLQAVTNELEMPFRNVENGLPLDALCRTIEISVCEMIDRSPPEDPTPQNCILT